MEYNDKNICEALKSRILILDGAMGTMIQSKGLTESDFAAGPFAGWPVALKGNNDVLNITRPDVIGAIHRSYIEAGSDVITTNTFNCTRISQQEYGCQEQVGAMALAGARIAREAADGAGRPVWVAGSLGPTSKSLSLPSDVNVPESRAASFDEMAACYRETVRALRKGGVDVLLPENGRYYQLRFYLDPYGREKYWYLAEDDDNGQYFTTDSAQAARWLCTRAASGALHFIGDKGKEAFDDYTPAGHNERNLVFDSFTNPGHDLTLQRGYSWGAFTLLNPAGFGCQMSVGGRFSTVRGAGNGPMSVDQRCNCTAGLVVSTDVQLIDLGSTAVTSVEAAPRGNGSRDVYSLDGRLMGQSLDGLAPGVYIYKGKLYIKR